MRKGLREAGLMSEERYIQLLSEPVARKYCTESDHAQHYREYPEKRLFCVLSLFWGLVVLLDDAVDAHPKAGNIN